MDIVLIHREKKGSLIDLHWLINVPSDCELDANRLQDFFTRAGIFCGVKCSGHFVK